MPGRKSQGVTVSDSNGLEGTEVLSSTPDLGIKVPFSMNNKLQNPPGSIKLKYHTLLALLEGLRCTWGPWCEDGSSQPSLQLHFNTGPQP